MKLVCLHMGRLLDQRNSGLSAAEGLLLEEHLATCAACRADANVLEGLSGLATVAHVGLSPQARERAIAAALAAGARPPVGRTVPPRRVGMLLLGAAAVLAIAFVAVQRGSREAAVASDRVLSGEVVVAGNAHGAGDALSSQVQLRTRDAAVVALGHARVELRADSDARWDGASRQLELQRGSAVFEVDPTPHQSFRVETKAFSVMVLGTRFEVTQDAVVVLSGRVSVQPKAAGSEPIVLSADSERTRFDLQPQAATTTSQRAVEEPQPRAAGRLQPRGEVEITRPARMKPEQRVDASALLEQARSQLAARELTQARATLKLAAPHLRDSALRAQALSLEAECELQARRFGAARDAYLRVARKFPGLAAAETALFAAARIEAEHGEPARAAELLRAYLAKYPQGSFVREAERRAQLLPARGTP